METTEKSVEVLNDLVEINNDRIAGFERAIKDLDDNNSDLKSIFENYSSDSRKNVQELTTAITHMGGDADTGTSTGGALHRAWIDVKATFGGNDRKSILAECERGEDAIKKAYKDALAEGELPQDVVTLLTQQQQKVTEGHDRIKALRDAQA